MMIRCSAKAIILHNGEILVNRCREEKTGEIYYDLPGGGQHPFETMEEAVVREVLEETGYAVETGRFAAVAEEIYEDEELQAKYPEYCHRILHIFLARLMAETGEKNPTTSETDWQQEDSEWVSLEQADRLPFTPRALEGKISAIVCGKETAYLGSRRM